MKKTDFRNFVHCLTLLSLLSFEAYGLEKESPQSIALIETNMGNLSIELFEKKAPKTVANFIEYANNKFYDGTIFHRVISNFMIQGGGFDKTMTKKATRAPIVNEASPSIPNSRGTIAMARTSDPHSATAQFFINVVNNDFLNKSATNPGYAVFGHVIKGMDVADKISLVQTGTKNYMRDVPKNEVIIKSITITPFEKQDSKAK